MTITLVACMLRGEVSIATTIDAPIMSRSLFPRVSILDDQRGSRRDVPVSARGRSDVEGNALPLLIEEAEDVAPFCSLASG